MSVFFNLHEGLISAKIRYFLRSYLDSSTHKEMRQTYIVDILTFYIKRKKSNVKARV